MKPPRLKYFTTKLNRKDKTANVTIYSVDLVKLFELDMENFNPELSEARRIEKGEYQCIRRYDASRSIHWYLRIAYDIITIGDTHGLIDRNA